VISGTPTHYWKLDTQPKWAVMARDGIGNLEQKMEPIADLE
jgi:hypothetical protein